MRIPYLVISALVSCLYISCYSFKGISIPPDVKTFYMPKVTISDIDAPPDTPDKFMEALRDKVRSQSSLRWNELSPDVEFVCDISQFQISSEAIQQGDQVSLNKLTMGVKVEYLSRKNEEDNWQKTFRFGIPFDADTDLNSVQNDLIDEIFDQIAEQVFNEAFTDW